MPSWLVSGNLHFNPLVSAVMYFLLVGSSLKPREGNPQPKKKKPAPFRPKHHPPLKGSSLSTGRPSPPRRRCRRRWRRTAPCSAAFGRRPGPAPRFRRWRRCSASIRRVARSDKKPKALSGLGCSQTKTPNLEVRKLGFGQVLGIYPCLFSFPLHGGSVWRIGGVPRWFQVYPLQETQFKLPKPLWACL